MHTNEMRPRVIKQDFQSNPTQRRLFENGESKILVAIKDTHAFISHNLGISWKQIDKVSGSKLEIIQTVEKRIIISDPDTDRLYLIDGRGNVIKEIVFKLEAFWNISVHPTDTNAILISNIQTNLYDECDEYYEQSTHYYTKDGGASGFVVQGQCDHCEYDLDVLNGIIHYEFIAGGARDLIYEYSAYDDGYTAYALNFFSESPLEFTRFPFVVRQSQGIFFGISSLPPPSIHRPEDLRRIPDLHISFPVFIEVISIHSIFQIIKLKQKEEPRTLFSCRKYTEQIQIRMSYPGLLYSAVMCSVKKSNSCWISATTLWLCQQRKVS